MTKPNTSLATASQQNPKYSLPSAPARDVLATVERIFSVMKTEQVDHRTFSISEKIAPSPEQRQVLAARGRDLAAHLQRVDGAEAKKVIVALVTRLMASYPQLERVSRDIAADMMANYVDALSDVPLWAVKAACDSRLRGEGEGSHVFPPSAAELRVLAVRKQMPFRQEYEMIRRILEAKVRKEPTPEERERAAARIDVILKGFGTPATGENPHTEPLHAGVAPAPAPPPSPVASAPVAPPHLSPALRTKLGIPAEGVSA